MEMKANTMREKVLEEIKSLPEEKLPEILKFIRSFRLGMQRANARPERVTSFAGSWRDMPDEMYDDFINDITKRRQAAFSGRRHRETDIS